MNAIILAAGSGRRMQPLSAEGHKALLPIGDNTILGRIVDALLSINVHTITVVTGYRDDDVRRFLGERFPQVPFIYVHNHRFDTTNNVVSLTLALNALPLDRDVILIECDLAFDPAVLRHLSGIDRGNLALVDHYRAGMDGTVVSVEDGLVTRVHPPHLQGRDFVYGDKFKTVNIYRFDRDFCRTVLVPLLDCYANQIDGNCYYELVLGMLINMGRAKVSAVVVSGEDWIEIDDPNDFTVAQFMFEPARRPEILDRTMGGTWNFDVIDFALMANVHFPTGAMLASLREALPTLVGTYGSTQLVLNEKLAWFLGCRPDRVQLLHGASQAFPWLRQLVGDRPVLLPTPTFGEYPRMWPQAATYLDAPGYDLDALVRTTPHRGVLVIVNPNSPTGTPAATETILGIARNRSDLWVIVDESFLDFSYEPSIVDRLEKQPLANVTVIKSLSKTLGIPGLRLGYVYSTDARLIGQIGTALPIWNVSAPGEYLLELVVKHRSAFAASIRQTIEDRAVMAAELSALPIVDTVFPSGGNFLLFRLAGHDPALGRQLRDSLLTSHRINVKDVSGRFEDRHAYIRVAVRGPQDNARLTTALAAVTPAMAVSL